MKSVDARNKIIDGLRQYLQIPVNRANQVSPESELPYVVYSVLAPYIKASTLGHLALHRDNGGNVFETRSEQAGMSLSFTVCSQSRTGSDGKWVFGEDEAMSLAERAQGWFLHAGRRFLSPDIVVESVENVVPRGTLIVDEEANRYGFDVLVKYIYDVTADVGAIEIAVSKEGKEIK